VALEAGLDAVGFADARPFRQAYEDLTTRKAAGLHAGMGFTYNKPERSTTPELSLPGARSLVVGALRYGQTPSEVPDAVGPRGRVGAYAQRDHYALLRAALRVVAVALKAEGHRARVAVDDNALVDRPAAYRAGLGWFGKNSNLLHPGWGSWFVIGSVMTDRGHRGARCGRCPPLPVLVAAAAR
jgi:epoxyqueuosine reductase